MKAFMKTYDESGFELVSEVILTKYDGDKYVTALNIDGGIVESKRWAFAKDKEFTKLFSRRDWWKLEGKDIKNFKPRMKKTEYYTYDDTVRKTFKNKRDAIKHAFSHIEEDSDSKTIYRSTEIHTNGQQTWTSGDMEVICEADGQVVQWFGTKNRKRGRHIKYLKGFGKKPIWNKKLCKYFGHV